VALMQAVGDDDFKEMLDVAEPVVRSFAFEVS
jgi:hypothetical protein